MKGLTADPSRRWQTAAEMVNEFREAEIRMVTAARAAAEKGTPLTSDERRELDDRIAAARRWLDAYAPDEAKIAVRSELPVDAVAALSDTERAWLAGLADRLSCHVSCRSIHLSGFPFIRLSVHHARLIYGYPEISTE